MASTFNTTLLLVAASMAAAGCQQGVASRAMQSSTAATGPGMDRLRTQLRAAADAQMRQAGVALAEARVQAGPEDIEARRTLAQVYFSSGRLRSAAQAYDDALALAPGDEALRFKKALALLAQGNGVAAVGELDRISHLPDAGLAYALAGQPARGVELLAQAARAPGATPRTRQNLALAYALAGQWARAKVVAGQDLAPADLEARIRGWALLASVADPAVQTASLLAVTPDLGDAGRPIGLAYIPAASRVTTAAAAASDAVVTAELAIAPAPARAAPAPKEARDSALLGRKRAMTAVAATKPDVATLRRVIATSEPAATRQWVVQLGAYDRPELLESNWQRLQRRTGQLLDGYAPSRTEKLIGERRYYRLSIAGFTARDDAEGLCDALKAKGRDCFVRRVTPALPEPSRA